MATKTKKKPEVSEELPEEMPAHEVGGSAAKPELPADEPLVRLDPANAYDSPEALAKWDAESCVLIAEAEEEVRQLESDWLQVHAEASSCKKQYEAAVESLRALIRTRQTQRGKPQQQTLFDNSDKPQPVEHHPTDDAWKSVPLESLSLPKGLLEKLKEADHKDRGRLAPIATLGELAHYQEPEAGSGYCKRLTDLKGIGEGAAEKIAAACEQYWAEQALKPQEEPEKPVPEATEENE